MSAFRIATSAGIYVLAVLLAGTMIRPALADDAIVVLADHLFLRQGTSQTFSLSATDTGDPQAQDIEGMTFTLQLGMGTSVAPSMSAVNFLGSTIWDGHVTAANVSPAMGNGPQFQSFTLITSGFGDYVTPSGTLAKLNINSGAATTGDYPLKLVGTRDPDADSQFTDGEGNEVVATFGSVTLSIVTPGDFDRNNQLTLADLDDMFLALTNKSSYETLRTVSDSGLMAIGDLNNDHSFDNLDIQAMLQLLKQPSGSQSIAVPEPPGNVLILLGICGLLAVGPSFSSRRRQFAASFPAVD